jgi:malonate-semialdehyde dehydrogenase (acetylating)/methylmalonate-semialdehyde dehydrogenase
VLALREELLRRREELVALVSADMGKTLADADGEVGRGIESVEAAAAVPHLLKGETLEGVAAGVDVELVRQPVGVVAAITPFNFPAMIPLWFLPFAIACGNSFVLKPSEQDPRPAALITEIVDSIAEIPPGVVNLVHGGRAAVTAILEDPGIDAISFVGRAETARIVAAGAARTGKRVQALGGAKNALVVMPDADLGQAVPAIMGSAFGAAGQRCLAGSVCAVVGDEARQAEVRDALVAAASELIVGPGDDPATDVCPMVSAAARDKVAEAIDRAAADGAELLLDGRGDAGPAGTLLSPTIAAIADHETELAREELFGPL